MSVSTLLYQMAQSLIVHDDFTILPQGQAPQQEESREGVVLYRRQWNTMQVVRLLPADGFNLEQIERLMAREVRFLDEARKHNAVQNMYAVTILIFSNWRSDANMQAIAEAGVYGGMTKNRGAAAVAVDAARGVLGPLPKGAAGEEINWQSLRELVERSVEEEVPEDVQARTPEEWQWYLSEVSNRRQARVREALRPEKKTVGVQWLLGFTVLIWLAVLAYPSEILGFGLLIHPLIEDGEFWRLLTPVFLHYEVFHIAFNMLSLYIFGRFVERIYGLPRFLIIYLIAGIAGSLLSFALNDRPSLGASGAIFGLFGALLAFGQYDRRSFAMTIGTSVYGLLIINLIFGFLMPNVDNWGHIGGLIGGYLIAMVVGVPKHERKASALYALGYAAFAGVTLWMGMSF